MNSYFAAQQRSLRERLLPLLTPLHPLLKSDVVQTLESHGKLLATSSGRTPSGTWALLSLLVARSVNPTIADSVACSVGVASECFVCALDLLDDIEDEDQTPLVQLLGAARILNVSTTLLMLAQQSLLVVEEQHIPAERLLLLLNALQSYALRATAGQHRDLLAESRPATEFTQADCIEIAEGKAGAIMSLVCVLGAIVADADDELCAQFATMGTLLGIAHQLDNDSHDLYDLLQSLFSTGVTIQADGTNKSIKSDIARGKKTLPLVLAANRGAVLQSGALDADENSEAYRDVLQESIIASWGISLLYRERARECLREIEARNVVDPALRILLGFE